ncbi:MAG: response regulator transcription factor [Oligoflexales bacterium]
MKTVLVVEDDKSLASGLALAITSQGHKVIQSFDGEDGLHKARTANPSLMILDIMMPHLNGFEVISELRREGNDLPILVLSARSATSDKVRGLDLGADDYLSKPFELEEFLARVRRLLKVSPFGRCQLTNCSFDFDRRMLLSNNSERMTLTPKELCLLEYFLKRDERIVSRESVLNAVWGDDYEGTDRTIDNLVVSLRKKIGEGHIETIRGQGYRFVIKP